jgi:hypothetical protein
MPPRHPSLFIAVQAYLTSLAAEGSLAHHPLTSGHDRGKGARHGQHHALSQP